ncbi:MAG TPA: argininosuccinate synthase [Gemmataceae bacterium]|nr:argininosuccinate synthase [Gemmataceae bacterium]
MNASHLKGQTIAFAASGGLDSCTITRWLTELGVKVVAFTADMAQPDETDLDGVRQRMVASGAIDFIVVPLRDAIAEAGLEIIQAQAYYEGRYWNTTGIGRHVIVSGMIPEMRRRNIRILSHGATGRGNDQVRFQLVTNMLAPDFQVYAPWRDPEFLGRFRGRSEMIDYCLQRKLPIKATRDAPYSTDANLLGLTHEAGKLESLHTPPGFITPGMGVHATDAPNEPEKVTVRFEKGRPVSINGEKVDAYAAITRANRLGGRHGVGIATHLVENRFVGVKSRGVYEAPGMELLGTCYAYLLQLILDRRARELFDHLSGFLARQVYQGYGYDFASRVAKEAVRQIADLATGTIAVTLYKGNVAFASASDVPHSLYSEENASMEAIGEFDHADSEGFLRVLSVSARALAAAGQVRP